MKTQHEEMQLRAKDNDAKAPARLQSWRKLGYPKNQKKQGEGQEKGTAS